MSNCKNCGTELKGKYCYACGEKQVDETDRKFINIIKEFINSFTFYDNKFFRTIGALFFRPGKLTNEYITGIRKPYLKPIQLFLLINLIYFLVPFSIDMFHTRLSVHVKDFPYSSWAAKKVNNRIDALYENNKGYFATHEDASNYYSREFNKNEENYAKILIVFNIFIFAFFSWLFNIKRKPNYYSDHFIFATHFYSFFVFGFLVIIAGILLLLISSNIISNVNVNDGGFILYTAITILTYLTFANKKVFGNKWLWAIIKSFGLLMGFIVSVLLYRFILFLVTYWLI